MSNDLVKRLSLLADSIELGDKLRWGEDSAALRDAKDRIEELEAENRKLKIMLEELHRRTASQMLRSELTGGKDD